MTGPTRDVFQLELEKRGVVQAVTDDVTGVIELLAGGYRFNAGVPYRESKSQHVYGNAGIIDEVLKSRGRRWHIFAFGDSRLNGIVTTFFAKRSPAAAAIAGIEYGYSGLAQAGFSVGLYSPNSGDALPTSPGYGYSVDSGLTGRELTLVAGTTPSFSNTMTNRLTFSAMGVSGYGTLPTLLNSAGGFGMALVRKSALGWSAIGGADPRIYLQARPDGTSTVGATGYRKSLPLSVYSGGEPGYSIAAVDIPSGLDWSASAYSNYSLEYVAEPAKAVTNTGKVASVSAPWLEANVGGFVIHQASCVSGATIQRFLNDETTPYETFAKAIPAYGGRPAFICGIGTNNPNNLTSSDFYQALQTLVCRFRLAFPDAPVIFTTNYQAQSDSGVEPYYVQPLRDLAARDENVVVIDTYVALPTYAAGAASGLYADTVHYNDAGKSEYADAFWQLAISA